MRRLGQKDTVCSVMNVFQRRKLCKSLFWVMMHDEAFESKLPQELKWRDLELDTAEENCQEKKVYIRTDTSFRKPKIVRENVFRCEIRGPKKAQTEEFTYRYVFYVGRSYKLLEDGNRNFLLYNDDQEFADHLKYRTETTPLTKEEMES